MNLPLSRMIRIFWNLTFVFLAFITISSCRPDDFPKRQFATHSVDVETGLVAYLPFNMTIFDATSNKNNAQLGEITGSKSLFTEDRKRNSGSAFLFNGTTYLKIEDSPTLHLRSLSLSFWFRPENVPSRIIPYQHLIYKANYDKDSNQEFSTSIDWQESIGVRFKADVKQNSSCEPGYGWESLIRPIDLQASTWYHVAILFMSNRIVVYINGRYFSEQNLPSNTGIDSCSGGDIIIGAQSNRATNFFKGAIDEFRIYNVSLTQEQITELSKP